MNLLEIIFGKRKFKNIPESEIIENELNKSSDFSIEYYPLTGRYYPKYKDYYLKKSYSTGIVESTPPYLFGYCDYGKTQEEANKIIELFKEHQLKENVKVIKI